MLGIPFLGPDWMAARAAGLVGVQLISEVGIRTCRQHSTSTIDNRSS
jgi:hypothetical protein